MDDRAVLVEEAQTGYGTLGGDEETVPKRTCLSPLYDRCLPAIVWIQITLGLPGPTDKPTEETGSKAYSDVTKFGEFNPASREISSPHWPNCDTFVLTFEYIKIFQIKTTTLLKLFILFS